MSTEISTLVWKYSKQKGSRLLVLSALADYANAEGWSWPSIKSLCQRTRMSERYVQKMLTEIAEDNELEIKSRAGSSNYYRVTIEDGVNPGAPLPPNQSAPGGEPQITGGVNQDAPRTVSRTVSEPLERKSLRSIPPKIEEVKEYMKERGISNVDSEAEGFMANHQSKGWMLGRNKMVDWRAAVVTWQRNGVAFKRQGTQEPRKDPNAGITKDSVWQGELWLLCNDFNQGEAIEPIRAEKKILKAQESASEPVVWAYIREHIPDKHRFLEFERLIAAPVNGRTE